MKIFGVGLGKTGTKSLCKALEMLGFKSIHYPDDSTTRSQLKSKDYNLSIMQEYDAALDTPIAIHYKELDQAFPGSKFILTTRRLDSWLESMQYLLAVDKHLLSNPMSPELIEKAEFLIEMYRQMYRGNSFEECIKNLEMVHRIHNEKVKNYFGSRLLVLDVDDQDKWTRLCAFLEKPIPSEPYPIEGKRSHKYKSLNWPKGMDEHNFSENVKESIAGRARTINYRYEPYLNLKSSKIMNICHPGGELKEAMSNCDVEDWVIGTTPPSGRFDVLILYDVLDHLSNEQEALDILVQIYKTASIDATMYVLCHPYSSRLGTHLYRENKAYLHLLVPDLPGQKATLKLPKPIRVYKSWFDQTGWRITWERETTEKIEDFFKPFVHLEKFNTNVQFAEYFLRKTPKLFV